MLLWKTQENQRTVLRLRRVFSKVTGYEVIKADRGDSVSPVPDHHNKENSSIKPVT